MAVNGPWGSGKSTILNFVLYYLQNEFVDSNFIVIRFNPWWFPGREDLTRIIIGLIRVRLGDKGHEDLRSKLADFSELVSKIPIIPGIEAGEFIAEKLRDQPDLASLKDKIDELLRVSNKRILVIVDDIDRLAPDEICDLFRTIKATGNFPNVIYLLAFEIDIVTKSLEKSLFVSGTGKSYLDKIVQVSFTLPKPDKLALQKFLFRKLDEIIAETKEEYFDASYWQNIYLKGLVHFISTPRDVIRLTNALQATYPSVENELNSVDFIATETVRIFLPMLYDKIRDNQDLLTIMASESRQSEAKDKRKDFFDAWLEALSEGYRVPVKNLLAMMFPKFSAAYGGMHYGPEWETTWRKRLRICSRDCFSIYFRFSLGPDFISNAEIKDLLRVTGDQPAFEQALLRYADQIRSDGSSKLRALLERLEDYTKDLAEKDIQPVISTFFDIGDKLMLECDEPRGFFGFGNDIQMGRLIHQLLMRVDEETRFKIVYSAIEDGSAIYIITHETVMWGQEHGKFSSSTPSPKDEQTFSEDHLKEIEDRVLDKIVEAAKDDSLLSVPVPHLVGILYPWSKWAGSDTQVQEWVNEAIKTDRGLVSVLPHYGYIIRGQGLGDVTVKHKYRLDPERLKPFIDPDKIAERLMKMDFSGLNKEQKKAVDQFLHEYMLKKEGKNTDLESWND